MKAIKKSLEKNKKSYGFAWKGIMETSRGNNFRFQLAAAIIVIALGLYLKISLSEWIILILCIGLVLMAESFNTALELLVDLVSPESHPLAGKVKDVSAGAVLLIALSTLVIGILIFGPKILVLIN
jgi:diacylglycerol kinase (ATP)